MPKKDKLDKQIERLVEDIYVFIFNKSFKIAQDIQTRIEDKLIEKIKERREWRANTNTNKTED